MKWPRIVIDYMTNRSMDHECPNGRRAIVSIPLLFIACGVGNEGNQTGTSPMDVKEVKADHWLTTVPSLVDLDVEEGRLPFTNVKDSALERAVSMLRSEAAVPVDQKTAAELAASDVRTRSSNTPFLVRGVRGIRGELIVEKTKDNTVCVTYFEWRDDPNVRLSPFPVIVFLERKPTNVFVYFGHVKRRD